MKKLFLILAFISCTPSGKEVIEVTNFAKGVGERDGLHFVACNKDSGYYYCYGLTSSDLIVEFFCWLDDDGKTPVCRLPKSEHRIESGK